MIRKTNTAAAVIKTSLAVTRLKTRNWGHLKIMRIQFDEVGALVLRGKGMEVNRSLYRVQRLKALTNTRKLVKALLPRNNQCFADGAKADARPTSSHLSPVAGGPWQSDRFRFASLTWSVPVSSRYGSFSSFRSLDESNGNLIGVLAIYDFIFNLGARDSKIGWAGRVRIDCPIHVTGAYAFCSVPAYNQLLINKLVAATYRAVSSVTRFDAVFDYVVGMISLLRKRAKLPAVSTTSSMGKSSPFNHPRWDRIHYFRSVRFKGGWD